MHIYNRSFLIVFAFYFTGKIIDTKPKKIKLFVKELCYSGNEQDIGYFTLQFFKCCAIIPTMDSN